MAVGGEPAEEWVSCVWRDTGGCGLCDEQRQLLLKVRYLDVMQRWTVGSKILQSKTLKGLDFALKQ